MPRQPFLPTFAHLDYAVGARVLNNRPEFTSAIGKCIAVWSQSDNEIGNLFGILLGTDSAPALEVFLSLKKSSNQCDALRAVAKHRLSGQEKKIFDAIIQLYQSLEKQRNALAHGCYGVASNDPDALLWIDIRDHVYFQTEVLSRLARGDDVPDPHEHLKKKMFVYRTSDLETLHSEMDQFWEAVLHFNSFLRSRSGPHQPRELERICTRPLIKAAMDDVVSKDSTDA